MIEKVEKAFNTQKFTIRIGKMATDCLSETIPLDEIYVFYSNHSETSNSWIQLPGEGEPVLYFHVFESLDGGKTTIWHKDSRYHSAKNLVLHTAKTPERVVNNCPLADSNWLVLLDRLKKYLWLKQEVSKKNVFTA